MPKLRKILILTLLLVMMITTASFAETEESGVQETWFSKIITESFGAIFNAISDALLLVVPKAEDVYMPKSSFLFSFSGENIFGAFTAKAYPLFKLIASIMVMPALLIAFMGVMTSKSGYGRNDSLQSVKTLFLAVAAMWFLPNIINFILEQRDVLSEGISNLFSMGEFTGFVDSMQELAKSDDAKFLDTAVYLGSVTFSVWLMFNYIGLTFGFSILFLYTPIALILTPAQFGKKVFSEFGKDLTGYVLTPLLDITLLGIVTTIRTLSAENLGMTPIAYNLISIALIFFVIPTRSSVKKKLGFGTVMGDMMGTGLMMGAVGMISRSGRGSYQSKSDSSKGKNSRSNGYENEPDYEGQASYYRDLDTLNNSPSEVRGGVPALYDSAISNDNSPFNSLSREDFLSKHQGKSYFNEKDIGGLSNSEKADYFNEKATEEKFKKYEADELARKTKNMDALKSGVKFAAQATGTMVGASAGMFGGGKGVMIGSMAGGMIGGKLGNSATKLGGVVNAYNATKEGPPFAGFGKSVFKKSSEDLEANLESGFGAVNDMGNVEYINAEPVDDTIKGFPSTETFEHSFNVKPNIGRAFEQSETQSNEEVGNLMGNVKERALDVLTEKDKKALENCSYEDYPKISHNFKVEYENVTNAADMAFDRFKDNNSQITKENYSIIVDKMDKNELKKADFKEAGDKMEQQKSEALLNIIDDVKKETGVDLGQYMDYFVAK